MISALDTLLEAARYIELQEQQEQLRQQQQQQQEQQRLTVSLSSGTTNGTTNSTSTSTTSTTTTNNNNNNNNANNINNNNNINNSNINVVNNNNSINNHLHNSANRFFSPNTNNNSNINFNNNHNINNSSNVNYFVNNHQQTSILSPSTTIIGRSSSVNSTSSTRKRLISNSSTGSIHEEPLLNGHSLAPPLVVISSNTSATTTPSTTLSSLTKHRIHTQTPPLTIDLSTRNISAVTNLTGTNFNTKSIQLTPITTTTLGPTTNVSPTDDSQSSLNLSSGSSGYISSGANSSNSSSLNLSNSSSTSTTPINGILLPGTTSSPLSHDLQILQHQQQQPQTIINSSAILGNIPIGGGRRRTTSSTSNGAGTREVHNKLEKNRRAHLKECFEQLKKQLPIMTDEKKTSNLSILGAAIRHIQHLKRKEREYEHEMERLAKEKISAQNRILVLRRELSQWDIDLTRFLPPETDATSIKSEKELLSDTNNSTTNRNGLRYSSSSSLSSIATTSSTCNLPLQTTISPVLLSSSPSRTSPTRNISSSSITTNITPTNLMMPLSLTTKPTTNLDNPTSTSILSSSAAAAAAAALKITTTLPNGLNLTTVSSSNNSIGNNLQSAVPLIATVGGVNNNLIPINLRTATVVDSTNSKQIFNPVTATILTGSGTALQSIPLNLNSSVTNPLTTSSSTSATSLLSSSSTNHTTTPSLQIISTTGTPPLLGGGNKDLISSIPTITTTSTIGSSSSIHNNLSSNNSLQHHQTHNNSNNSNKNGLRGDNKIEIITAQSQQPQTLLEPSTTKVIKLINGNTISNNKMLQVVQQNGLVVSPIQLLTSSQGLRVISQPNALATIELSSPANVSQSHSVQSLRNSSNPSTTINAIHTNHHLQKHQPQQLTSTTVSGAQLQKLLISGGSGSTLTTSQTNGQHFSTSNNSNDLHTTINGNGTLTTTTITSDQRLPGGAELNILPAGTNGTTTALYRGQSAKLAFLNSGNNSGLTIKEAANNTIVVSRYDQDGNLAGLFATPQAPLAKMVKTSNPLVGAATQYLNLKPMMVTVTSSTSGVTPSASLMTSSTSSTLTNNATNFPINSQINIISSSSSSNNNNNSNIPSSHSLIVTTTSGPAVPQSPIFSTALTSSSSSSLLPTSTTVVGNIS
uniref:Max-binding protein MNT n=1 Tax=Corethrella appendiculata TaxID=1370023 RepID=U5ESY6_9DIPT